MLSLIYISIITKDDICDLQASGLHHLMMTSSRSKIDLHIWRYRTTIPRGVLRKPPTLRSQSAVSDHVRHQLIRRSISTHFNNGFKYSYSSIFMTPDRSLAAFQSTSMAFDIVKLNVNRLNINTGPLSSLLGISNQMD